VHLSRDFARKQWRGGEVNEHQLQASIIAEVDLRANLDARWALIFAVPNGGHRSKATAGKLKAEGVRAGVLDLCLPLPAHTFHGMFMELKVGRGRLSLAQQSWFTRLRERGYYCTVIWDSPSAAIQEFEWFISGAKL
jgi:hypothetical protein